MSDRWSVESIWAWSTYHNIAMFYSVLNEEYRGWWKSRNCCIYKSHGECLIRSRKCLPFRSFWVHTRVLVETVLLTFLVFCVKANIRYIENEVIDLIINPIRKRKSNSSILYNGIWYETNVSNFTPFWLPVWYLQNLFYVI